MAACLIISPGLNSRFFGGTAGNHLIHPVEHPISNPQLGHGKRIVFPSSGCSIPIHMAERDGDIVDGRTFALDGQD